MRGLENDQYVRQIDGYLPTAEVAFIDEIFKANSAILNALLTLLNERLFDNGNQRFPVPLLCLVGPMQRLYPVTEACSLLSHSLLCDGNAMHLLQVGASNELPESEELDALFDRFLVRRQVAQVSSAQLPALARLAAGRLQTQQPQEAPSNGSSPPAVATAEPLTFEEFKYGTARCCSRHRRFVSV